MERRGCWKSTGVQALGPETSSKSEPPRSTQHAPARPPPIRGLYLHPSPSASAGCNPQSPASSTSPTRGSPAILHPHLVSSHTPSACLSPKPASSPGLLDHPLPPPRAHPLTPAPLASHRPLFGSPSVSRLQKASFFYPHESSRRPPPIPYLNPLEAGEV